MDWTNICAFPKGYRASGRPRLLLTGSNGLLGQALLGTISSLFPSHWEVIAIARGPARGPALSVPYASIDLTDATNFGAFVKALRPAYVLHTAAMTQVDDCEKQQQKAYAHNVTTVETLLANLPRDGFVLHFSTDFVFDGTQSPYREEDVPAPCNYYGVTKQLSEALLQKSRLPWTLIRSSWVYGTGVALSRPPLLLWARKALAEGRSLSMVHDQWRMPTFVKDLAGAALQALRLRKQGIFHISGEECFTPYDMLQTAAHYWGYPDQLIKATDTATLAQRAPRPRKTLFSLKKAKQALNYRSHSLRDALQIMDKTYPS